MLGDEAVVIYRAKGISGTVILEYFAGNNAISVYVGDHAGGSRVLVGTYLCVMGWCDKVHTALGAWDLVREYREQQKKPVVVEFAVSAGNARGVLPDVLRLPSSAQMIAQNGETEFCERLQAKVRNRWGA